MAMADANGDGKIDFQEYLLMAQINTDDKTVLMFNYRLWPGGTHCNHDYTTLSE